MLIMNAFLGTSGQGVSRQDFTFPCIVRRVETLTLLTPDGEKRHLSLDIDAVEFRKKTDIVRVGLGALPVGDQANNTYCDCIPIPFGVFSKGVLLDFSAKIDDHILSLEAKNTAWLAGYAWLLNSIPDCGSSLSDALRNRLWWICRHKPSREDCETLAPFASRDLNHPHKGDNVVRPEWTRADPPTWWWGYVNESDRNECNELLEPLDAAIQKEFYDLLFFDPDHLPTEFNYRLRLLTTSYFPLLLVPIPLDNISRLVVKVDFLYGDSDDEWLHRVEESRKPAKAEFDKKRPIISRLIIVMTMCRRAWSEFMSRLWPSRPYPWQIGLFGDLEGHCEHLNIVLPPGVELVAGSWAKDKKGSSSSETVQQKRVGWNALKNDVVQQVLCQRPNQANQNQECQSKDLKRVRLDTYVKFFTNALTFRRHASLPRGAVEIRFGLYPSLDGVFGPLAVSLLLLLVSLLAAISYRWIKCDFVFSQHVSFVGTDVAIWIGLISSVVSAAFGRYDIPLRFKMLRRLYSNVVFAAIIGVTSLWGYVYSEQVTWMPPWVSLLMFSLASAAALVVLHAFLYLFWSRNILKRGQKGIRNLIGRTKRIESYVPPLIEAESLLSTE